MEHPLDTVLVERDGYGISNMLRYEADLLYLSSKYTYKYIIIISYKSKLLEIIKDNNIVKEILQIQ